MIHLPFPVIVMIVIPIWMWFRIRHVERSPDVQLSRELVIHLFFVYMCVVFIVTMRPFMFQLPSLHTISFDFYLFERLSNMEVGYEMLQLYYALGNVVMLVPFGFLLPILFPFARHFLITTMFGFSCSLTIELIQTLFTPSRRGTVDDLVLNTIGAIIGYVVFRIIYDRTSSRKSL